MRKGFRSSRGAMRGTMGGAPICLVGAVGFATVAIGVGPFVYSIDLRNSVFTWPKFKISLEMNSIYPLAANFLVLRRTHRGMPGSRNEEARPLPATEWKASHPRAYRRPDRALAGVPQRWSAPREKHPQHAGRHLRPRGTSSRQADGAAKHSKR